MDEQRLRALVVELDALVPREGGLLRISERNPRDDTLALGDEAGVLRLGVELMRATLAAAERRSAGRDSVAVLDLEFDDQSDVRIGAVELVSALPLVPAPPRRPLLDRVMMDGRIVLVFALIAAVAAAVAFALEAC